MKDTLEELRLAIEEHYRDVPQTRLEFPVMKKLKVLKNRYSYLFGMGAQMNTKTFPTLQSVELKILPLILFRTGCRP